MKSPKFLDFEINLFFRSDKENTHLRFQFRVAVAVEIVCYIVDSNAGLEQ